MIGFRREGNCFQGAVEMMNKLNKLVNTLSELGLDSPFGFCNFLARQVYREWNAYGLRRDLQVESAPPTARIPISIRELRDGDIPVLFEGLEDDQSRSSRLEIMRRMAFLAERVPTPYVAIDLLHNRPCFLQWLMTSEVNAEIQSFFQARFPVLASDEALLEYAYTPAAYRGNGIMPAAISMISSKALEKNARYVMTFVLRENTAALKGCSKAGFSPFVIRRDKHYLFRLVRRRSFIPIKDTNWFTHERVLEPVVAA
jgi:hypothetical protein